MSYLTVSGQLERIVEMHGQEAERSPGHEQVAPAPQPVAAPAVAPVAASASAAPALTPGTVLGVQRSAGNVAATTGIDTARGRPAGLDRTTRSKMEPAFGGDLSDVRVHVDSPRAGASRLAVTEGSDIHFGPGAYQPGHPGGDWLIGHELAHVVQQRRGASGTGVGRSALEHDADRAADAAAAGETAQVALGAVPRSPQAYEANEHTDLGNVAGGDQIKVTTTSGVTLTYGEIVALSGDFYRSPEAVMNAPADELREILKVMKYEKGQVAKTKGLMTADDAAEINKRYEAATSTSERAKHHDHSSLFDDHASHDDDEDHDADEEAEDDERVGEGGKRRMTKYGPMVGDEHVEDAGQPNKGEIAGDKPSASGSFLNLADENSSHFSPENIRLNFKPKHLMAMDIAMEAFKKREGKEPKGYPAGAAPNAAAKAQGEGAEPGALPSARMHTTADTQQGAPQTGEAPQAPVLPGAQATPTRVSGGPGGKPGEQEEARALVVSAFAAHFLTDAFAGGHLVSGVEARKHATPWYSSNKSRIAPAVKAQWKADPANKGQSDTRVNLTVDGLLAAVEGLDAIPGVLLKLVHDKFNSEGLQVKNAKGTTWSTTGDGNLAASPQTKGQAELATKAARDVIQELVAKGETAEPYGALDYVPDVVKTPGSGFRPIEQAAKDKSVYEAVWNSQIVGSDVFYKLVKGYAGKATAIGGSMVKLKVLKGVESAKRGLRKAKKFLGDKLDIVKNWGAEQWDKAKGWGAEQWGKAKELGAGAVDKVKEIGSGAVDKVKELGSGLGGWLGDKWDATKEAAGDAWDATKSTASKAWDATKSAAGNTWDSIKAWGSEKVDQVKQAAGDAGKWIGDTWDVAKKWGADKVDGLVDGAKGIAKKLSGGSKAIADKVVELYRAGKRKAAGWVGEQADKLFGGDGKTGTPESETGRVSDVKQQTYAHGAFMGAGGAFMKDPVWSNIFKTLMPADHARVSKMAEPEKLMLALENNPVLAAYGSVRHLKEVAGAKPDAKPDSAHKALSLEWDVWLPPDPGKLTDLGAVKIAHGNLGTTTAQGVAGEDPVGFARDDIKKAPSGGQWMEIFGKAVAMHRGGGAEKAGGEADATKRAEQLKRLAAGTSGANAVAIAKEFLGANGGLILDVKSTYSTAAHIATFVTFLRGQGINVFGVGTFKPEQLDALDPATRKVKFFHGINDFERKSGELKKGDDVMFNGGSLLREGRAYVVAGKKTYEVDQAAYQRVVALQKAHSLNIGLYVQESSVAPDAIQRITELVNRNPGVFTRGFAYGNISGEAEEKSEGTGLGAQWILNR